MLEPSAILPSAEETIGTGDCSNSKWFEESIDVLKPLIKEKNQGICK